MSLTPDIWSQSLKGRAIDLAAPSPVQVDFREICDQLATINRYAGAAERPVSVANHTLVAVECALRRAPGDERLAALVLMHDFHETRLGDTPSPAQQAYAAKHEALWGPGEGKKLRASLAAVAFDHDTAIHKAAGIAMPSQVERVDILACDLAALKTERRDCLAPPPMAWAPAIEAADILPRRIRLLSIGDAADELHRLCLRLLPGARAQSEREVSIKARATGARVA
jgi:hypothetical protein